MTTPKEYNKSLKEGRITAQMLSDCLYSVNKRAKNCRDKAKEIRNMRYYNPYFVDRYGSAEKNEERKYEYYKMKEELLSIIKPVCIHSEPKTKRERYFDYEPGYYQIASEDVVYSGEYYDSEKHTEVEFVDVIVDADPQLYLFYDLGTDHTFHVPIDDPKRFDLEIKEIGRIITHGDEIDDLISVQFVRSVLDVIRTKQFVFVS